MGNYYSSNKRGREVDFYPPDMPETSIAHWDFGPVKLKVKWGRKLRMRRKCFPYFRTVGERGRARYSVRRENA